MGQKTNVAQRILYDIRDGNSYRVRKLADGNCWMTENLRLTGPRTLIPGDSNVSSNWTLPAANGAFPNSCVDTAYNTKSSTDAATYTSYGNYYNWYAATAGTGTCAMASGNAASSICPKGWSLPTGGQGGQFEDLYDQYPSATGFLSAPLNFILSGYRDDGGSQYVDNGGYYWSSAVYSTYSAYRLYLDKNIASPSYISIKRYGFTIRCTVQ